MPYILTVICATGLTCLWKSEYAQRGYTDIAACVNSAKLHNHHPTIGITWVCWDVVHGRAAIVPPVMRAR